MYINVIYPAFQGECNVHGMGEPVIFVRLQGCHIRCYQKTFGTLCDTPEGLNGKSGGVEMTAYQIMNRVDSLSHEMGGVKFICLTGGDPLFRKQEDLNELLTLFYRREYEVSVETSGTLSIKPYSHWPNVYWVLDYKTKSAGIHQKFIWNELNLLDTRDFIKFVLYDNTDYAEFTEVLPRLKTNARISVGVYWGGKITTMQLFNKLLTDRLLGKVTINAQLHKLAILYDVNADRLQDVAIPAEI